MGKLAKETIIKTPAEVILVNFIFPDGDFATGVNLTGVPTLGVTPSGPTLSSFSISARKVQAKISGGTAGNYQVTCRANDTGSPSQTHEGIGNLTVEALG